MWNRSGKKEYPCLVHVLADSGLRLGSAPEACVAACVTDPYGFWKAIDVQHEYVNYSLD